MARFTSLLEGKEIRTPEEDFRKAKKVEQYRIGERAVYLPAGLRWNYLPLAEIREAEEAHRAVTAGKCVAVTERRPTLWLKTEGGTVTLDLERPASLPLLLEAIRKAKGTE